MLGISLEVVGYKRTFITIRWHHS